MAWPRPWWCCCCSCVVLLVIALARGDGLPGNMVLALDLREPIDDSAPRPAAF